MTLKAPSIFLILLFVFACGKEKKVQVKYSDGTPSVTKDWLQKQLDLYDSLYTNEFTQVRNNPVKAEPVLIKAHVFLDSVLANEKTIIKDTTLSEYLLTALYYKGTDLNDIQDFSGSENTLNKYLVLQQQFSLPETNKSAYIHLVLGNIYSRFGDYNKAILHIKTAIAYYTQAKDTARLSSEIINIAIPFREKKMYDSAIVYLKKGVVLAGAETSQLLNMYTELASDYLEKNQIDTAQKYIYAAYPFYNHLQKSTNDFEKLASYKTTEAEIYITENKLSEAKNSLQKALDFFLQQYGTIKRREIGKVYNEIGNIYELMNNYDSAAACYHTALYTVAQVDSANIFSLPSNIYAENTILESLDALAGLFIKKYQALNDEKFLKAALDCYELSFKTEYKLLLNFTYNESKQLMLNESRERSEKAISICYTLYQKNQDKQWAEKAFSFAERNKAFILLESIKRNLATSVIAKNDTLFQQLQHAQQEYAYAETGFAEAENKKDDSVKNITAEQMQQTDKKLQQLQDALRFKNNAYENLLEKEDSLPISDINNLLNSNAAIIEYFTGDSLTYSIALYKDGAPAFIEINQPNAVIDSFINFFNSKQNITNAPYEFEQTAYSTYEKFILPCIKSKKINSLIIIPDGALNFVAFDALLTKPAKSLSFKLLPYLVNSSEISYGYSVATLLKQQLYTGKSSNTLLAFAPEFNHDERNLAPLPYSATEIKAIVRNIKGTYLQKQQASLSNFKRLAPSSSIIHLATHASADAEGAMPRIEFIDSTLYLNELYAMQLHAKLVVLSACKTGIGKVEKGEGAISLARGFYYAGAQNIITSLWEVNDEATASIFKIFYSNIKSNSYNNALHKAKINYLKSSLSNDKYSPYYWAGIIGIGISENPATNVKWIITCVVIILAIAGIIIYRTGKRFPPVTKKGH
ncbi:MAG: CHAT domain-containing protein [Parafilimonas sp.]